MSDITDAQIEVRRRVAEERKHYRDVEQSVRLGGDDLSLDGTAIAEGIESRLVPE